MAKKQVNSMGNDDKAIERLKNEMKFQQAKLLRYQQMATIGMMASGLAHEVMQPLQIILSTAENCQEEIRDKFIGTQGILKDLSKIATTAQRLDKIIRYLHRLSREPKTQSELVDVNRAIEDSLIGFQQQLKSRHIRINKNLADNLPPIQANKIQLEQVVINLISNARDALEGQKDKQITISTQTENGAVQLRFKDNGKGIAPNKLPSIFDAFVTTKGSTGLGLYITRDIVQTDGGQIAVESSVNEGTTFIITIPLAEEKTT